ncbi:MAG: UbiA family prenyltransferase [Archangium sp.]|nr:UbiA family prenyltransferase [Archangium sp.]
MRAAVSTHTTGFLALRALRAPQWAYFAVLPLAGALTFEPTRIALSLFVASASLAFAYGLNAVTERHTDASASKNPLVGFATVPRSVTLTLAACVFLALSGAAILGTSSLIAVSVSLAAGALYSAGPRLKSWPGAGLVANTLIFVPLLSIGVTGRSLPSAFPELSLVFTALLLQNQLVHELADAKEDEAAQALTTARSLGIVGTRALIIGIAIAAVLITRSFAALIIPTLITFIPGDWSRRRKAHRLASIVSGAALFASGFAS